jgi:Uma2 family endonuclease
MSAISQRDLLVSPATYLAARQTAFARHEYVSGFVYELTSETTKHSRIATNILGYLKQRLRESWWAYGSNQLVHLCAGLDERFYCPDVSIVSKQLSTDCLTIENPTVIFEVRSPLNDRYDWGEKRDAYLRCPSLKAFVLVASESIEVTIYERAGDEWKATVYTDQADILPLSSLTCELPLSEIYRE